jgi:glutathione S-transferase
MLSLCGAKCDRRTASFEPGVTVPIYADGLVSVKGAIPILRYVAAHNDPARWRSEDANVAMWLGFAEGALSSVTRARDVRLFGAAGDLATLQREARVALRTIEDHLTDRHLAGSDWLAGDAATLAEVAVFAAVALSHDAGIGHEDYPAINLWQRRLRKLDGFISMPGIPDYF